MSTDRTSEPSGARPAAAATECMAAASDRSVSVRFGGKRLLSLAAACGLQRIGRLYAFGVPHLSHPAGADGPAEDAPFGPR